MTRATIFCLVSTLVALSGACGGAEPGPDLLVYSGRSESLVNPLFERFEAEPGLEVEVRYGGSAELAAMILEQGDAATADVYFGQDAGALGALAKQGRLSVLPRELLERVPPRFRARDGRWVGASGRARVLCFNVDTVLEEELPDSVHGLTAPEWRGRVGWVPTNASFQAFVTAMRRLEGEDATRRWLQEMIANEVRAYANNPPLVEAVLNGEVEVGLTNHYYLHRFGDEAGEPLGGRNYSPRAADAGGLVNIAGAGILDTAPHQESGLRLIEFLLSEQAQAYFAEKTFEYPLVEGARTAEYLPPLGVLPAPEVDLGELDDLQGTIDLLRAVGAF